MMWWNMRLRLVFVECEILGAAFMKMSQLYLLPVLLDALCETAPNASLRNDHLGKLFLFFRGPLFQIIWFFCMHVWPLWLLLYSKGMLRFRRPEVYYCTDISPCWCDVKWIQSSPYSFKMHSTSKVNKRSLTDCPCGSSDLHSRGIRGTIVGIATCCGLDGLGCEPRGGDKNFFSTPIQTSPGAHPGVFLAAERPGSGIYRSLLPSAEVEKSIAKFLSLRGMLWGDPYLIHLVK
jgi:hypothetical protein